MTPNEASSDGCSTARTIRSGPGAWAAHGPTTRSSPALSRESWILPPATCRLDWRPSRLLAAALVLLGLLAGGCVLASGAPLVARLAIAAVAVAHALRLARRA